MVTQNPHWESLPQELAALPMAYGIASVVQALETVSFPCAWETLHEEAGDHIIFWTKTHSESLEEVLSRIPHQEFASLSELTTACCAVFENMPSSIAAP